MKLIIGVLIGTLSFPAMALRCSGQIINPGDSVHKVIKYCGEPSSSYSDVWNNTQTTYEKGGGNEEIKIIDGRVKELNFNRD